MVFLTLLGIAILILIQIYLFKNKNKDFTLKKFISSKDLLEFIKEFLIVILGVTLAIVFTDIANHNKNVQKAIKFLEVSQDSLITQNSFNQFFINNYEEENIDVQELMHNTSYDDSIIRNVLNNDTIMEVISPVSYSIIINEINNSEIFYSHLKTTLDDDSIYTYAKSLSFHMETTISLIEFEIKHLSGKYTEKQLYEQYEKIIYERFTIIND